ncbi:MAG: FKBP-type peptidyl-prolyl cis-trans isomerase [Bacteroidales bacterium]|nr:FKBP-type peptidyl-prolyl cis-trans isomerase [Bacteroidales bacterium]
MLLLCAAVITANVYGNENDDFQVAPNGVKYKAIVANPDGRQVMVNDIITITSALFINDSLVSENTAPMPMMVMEPQRAGDLFDAILLMREGETTAFAFDPKVYIGDNLPPFIKETDVINMTISLIKTQTETEFEADRLVAAEKLIAEEKTTLRQYMEENNINATETESGLFIAVVQEGTGQQAQPGDQVSVHYTGKLLNGKVFDSSVDRGTPIRFQVGVGQVIRGWDEGIVTMKVGEKAIFLIPSPLAYGERDLGDIPANSPLIFEVELVEIH